MPRPLGLALASLLLASAALHALVYLTAWTPGGAAWWTTSVGHVARVAAGYTSVVGLVLALCLPVVRGHWPGLLAGRVWRTVAIVAYAAFIVAIAVQEMAFRPVPGAEIPWTAAQELRWDSLYLLLLLALAMPLLFAPRRADGTAPGDG